GQDELRAELDDGAVVELGAEFVLPGYEMLQQTAARLGLELFEKGTLYGDREPRDGPPVTREELVAAYGALREPRSGSVGEVLETLVHPPGARAAIGARLAVSSGYELDDQDASALAEGASGFGDFPSHGIVGGNDRVALSFAERLGGAVHTSTVVTGVAWSAHGVVVRAGGDELRADGCVIATPAPHALELGWAPPLPGWKREALAAVRYGQAAKLFLPLTSPAPPSQTLSVPLRFWTWTQHGVAAASSFAGSPSALELLEVDDGPVRWEDAVRRLRPDLDYAPGSPLLSTWHDDPWARGAYSVRTLSSPLVDEALARPVGRVTFAGEHTAGEWHALMEGALRSGVRAARELEALL
ncbi:MAG TPA: NAD(P)/FAD-dependent oxidoreductase, partial [Gaiellaceae bacterium]|nr:NAD(P)/FAD-dependent oxidoreductase [Gaiellaceae bacterium]